MKPILYLLIPNILMHCKKEDDFSILNRSYYLVKTIMEQVGDKVDRMD